MNNETAQTFQDVLDENYPVDKDKYVMLQEEWQIANDDMEGFPDSGIPDLDDFQEGYAQANMDEAFYGVPSK